MARSSCCTRMHYTDVKRLFKMLGEETSRNFLSIIAEIAEERVMEPRGEKNDILLRLNSYEVSQKCIDGKISEQEVFIKAISASVKS